MSEIVGSPAFHNNRSMSRSARHGPAAACTASTPPAAATSPKAAESGVSTRSIAASRRLRSPMAGHIADLTGRLYCLDADTGHCLDLQTGNETWGSTLVADGKVYLVTRSRSTCWPRGRRKAAQLNPHRRDCTPIVADGVVYVLLRGTLYALHQGAQEPAAAPRSTSGAPPSPARRPARRGWPCWARPGNGFSAEAPAGSLRESSGVARRPVSAMRRSPSAKGASSPPITIANGTTGGALAPTAAAVGPRVSQRPRDGLRRGPAPLLDS